MRRFSNEMPVSVARVLSKRRSSAWSAAVAEVSSLERATGSFGGQDGDETDGLGDEEVVLLHPGGKGGIGDAAFGGGSQEGVGRARHPRRDAQARAVPRGRTWGLAIRLRRRVVPQL